MLARLKYAGSGEAVLSRPEKVKALFRLFLILLAGSFVIVGIQVLLENFEYIPVFRHLKSSGALGAYYPSYVVVIITIAIAPLVEEYAFRGFLKVSRINISLTVALFAYILISFVVRGIYIINTTFFLRVLVSIGLFMLFYQYLGKAENYEKCKSFIGRNFTTLFVLSAILFAYAHIYVFGEITFRKVLFSPIFLFQVFYFSLVVGYTRVKLGIGWFILLHGLFNGYLLMNEALIKLIEN